MLKRLLTSVALVAIGAAPSRAHAGTTSYGTTKTYDVCGGSYVAYSGTALCASVDVSVFRDNTTGKYYVSMKVYNTSGSNGSYAGSAFTRVGLDNVVTNGVNVNAIANSLTVTGPCAANPAAQCSYSSQWGVGNDKTSGGGINVDLLSQTDHGVNYGITSSCANGLQELFVPNAIVTDCAGASNQYAVFTFQISAPFDPSTTGDLYVMAQNGFLGQSSYCSTGAKADCTQMGVAPEPVTIALVGTGLGAFGGAGVFRRRRRKPAGSTEA